MSSVLEKAVGYVFKKPALLEQALTHPSANKAGNNQRLEFLGDAVLGLAVAKLLSLMFPEEAEGELARRQAGLVCSETLANVAREIGLGEHLIVGGSEESAGGRNNPTNLEDACEALIGAIFLDSGYEAAEAFVNKYWTALAKSVKAPPKDAKTALQEWAQGRGLPIPEYKLLSTTGPAHAPEFTVEVSVKDAAPIQANANTKRAAEQRAAEQLLQKLES